MKSNAYAKINLTLDILGSRPDGFHELSSVMVPVTLCDNITLEKSAHLVFDCNIKELCSEDNLCVRAAKLFFATVETECRASIYLEKKVPFPAGLGGGSADAACVLDGLNRLFGEPIEREKLFLLAAELGSDVPFCLLGAPALCEGRGELLTEIKGMPMFDTVIAIGKARLKTPEMFRAYDSAGLPPRSDSKRLLSAAEANDRSALIASLGNAFEPITDVLAPETKLIRAEMSKSGALASHLSGSGPSVYGIFESGEIAKECAEALKKMGFFAVYCQTVGR